MLRDALRLGITTERFWDLTPKELEREFRAAEWREKDNRNHLLFLSWHIGMMGRVKRIPPLKSLIHPEGEKKLSKEELKAQHEELMKKFGGSLGRG